jgi:D-lactate dehydrogenase
MNVPGYGDATVAEYAFGLLLALTRKIYQAADQIKETGSFSLEGLRGMDLEGKTIGIIGTGRIGKHAIRIAQGFSMQVLAHDLFPDLGYAKEKGFSYVSLDELLKSSDVISLHAPLTEKTTHLINTENIGKIKKGAYLINTARGGLVDTDALTTALQHGILVGAALDVLEEEGETKDELLFAKGHPKAEELRIILENHALMQMPNVLVTPHNAFNTREALERILKTTIENIKNFESGSPQNIVS